MEPNNWPVSMDEEIARLTRLCEEKDRAFEQLVLQLAEINRTNDLLFADRDEEIARLERCNTSLWSGIDADREEIAQLKEKDDRIDQLDRAVIALAEKVRIARQG